ncbi:class I SAM-dependent methyltransferase [bacterium]|nr:class I SAM-dependent methyltransferase [bacterium]
MKSETLNYYNNNFRALCERYNSANMSKTYKILDRHIGAADKVLDLGFGSGRDLLHLKRRGVSGFGLDGSDAFVELFKTEYPSMKEKVFHSILPAIDLPDTFYNYFSVIYSIATWMHLRQEEHFEAILNIKKYIKYGGTLIVSYSVEPREDDPRFFEKINPDQLAILFETFGFSLIESSVNDDGLNRKELTWITQVYKYKLEAKKGIDQIESILSQDTQEATCNFALLKSFAQIATSPSNRFASFKDGYIYFPIGLIVEKWIEIYWKLMDGETIIPQKKGGEVNRKLAFRESLKSTINFYSKYKNQDNPYYEFWNDYHRGIQDNTDEYSLVIELINTIITTIINGPVKYSGSSFDDTSFFILGEGSKSFSKKNRQIDPMTILEKCLSVGIKQNVYHELYRYGSWIDDSISLRWARFTQKLSMQSGTAISSGDIITLLSKDFIKERETAFARKVYDKYEEEFGELRSIWSSKKILEYELDHFLPYSVYSNSDLWNLLPISKKESNSKSDLLVTQELIRNAKEQIVAYWEYMKEQATDRFENEVYKSFNIDPVSNIWKDKLLSAISEQLEITASIRGLKRWNGF